jgi:hypothetical protein
MNALQLLVNFLLIPSTIVSGHYCCHLHLHIFGAAFVNKFGPSGFVSPPRFFRGSLLPYYDLC